MRRLGLTRVPNATRGVPVSRGGRMRRLLYGLVVLGVLWGTAARAQTTTTATTTTSTTTTLKLTPPFPQLNQGRIGQGLVMTLANGQRCNATPCETGPFHVMDSSYPGPVLYIDCTGTCAASVLCRMPDSTTDVSLGASGSVANSSKAVAITGFCPYAYFQITTCTTCNVRAWLVNSRAD